ncbi:hypothetical protein HNQ56_002405 [Anaerotaenia torta]|uniref:NAD(P)/FAD-dependent oxidoreductase n=1 Tax=Anaerotaenia torta TaxID=433293 RepID=UPI003D21EBF9
MKYDIIIVGAGASGLTAAIAAAREGSSVLVIEHKDKAGKKISATGNGKCNFTNIVQNPDCYRSDDSTFASRVLSCFDVQKTLRFFDELGIYPREREGYYYPNSEQAASVVQVLLMEGIRLGVVYRYQERVVGIKSSKKGGEYIVSTLRLPEKEDGSYQCRRLILAAGGCASPQLGSDGSGFRLAESLGHRIIKPLPALVQLKSPDRYCKTVSGVRTIARVEACTQKGRLSVEQGEIIFTDYGISGIPVFQVSRYIARALDQGTVCWLLLDFMKDLREEELKEKLRMRSSQNPHKTLEEMLIGLLNHKLNYMLLKEAGLDPALPSSRITGRELERLARQMKQHRMQICGTNSFEQAQVCAGGVDTGEVEAATLESRLHKGLYLTGELLDVDGTCGGYNLQWAWSTGYLAGRAAGSIKE